ncbi:hypothetical protein FACS1894218_5770 [Bacilli bacterium]|nr:hypothetical protein FACS1894218_5770 [Bacilli bacterium]
MQLHKQKTDVAFLGARADGEKNTATSTAIIFDFNNDMGTLDTSNLTITGFVDDNTRTAPSINSVAHDGGGKYTAHLSADV